MEPWRQVLVQAWKDSRLTLDELSEASGLNRGTIHRILDDKTDDPGFNTIAKLAAAFGADVSAEVAKTLIVPRPGNGAGRVKEERSESGSPWIEDRLSDLLAYIKTLEGKGRADFIRAVIALLTALEHARPAASSGPAPDDGR